MIPFNKPFLTGRELEFIRQASELGKLSGNGEFSRKCHHFFESTYGFGKCFLTSSCTDALEMAALLFDIQPGDEVILPSFTFVSTANAFALRGASLVFVDSKSDFPGMDESQVEQLITPKTKAIVAVHYGGVGCQMKILSSLAEKYGLFLLEDAAQCIDGYWNSKPLGTFGHLATFSFHETKNIHCGEGGMLVVNDLSLSSRAEILWEKGTNRSALFRGEIQKYGWVDLGSSFLLSEINAAFLYGQLLEVSQIQDRRKAIWEDYHRIFSPTDEKLRILPEAYGKLLKETLRECKAPSEQIQIQSVPGNYHLFYLLFDTESSRIRFSDHLLKKGILSVFHYQCLHKSEFIQKHQPTTFLQELPNSEKFSRVLLRLPLFYDLPEILDKFFQGNPRY
jgi:dTDP-4-amino-4,6-dideoxygalactose transaminase